MKSDNQLKLGSLAGLGLNLAVGFGLYFLVQAIQSAGSILDYNQIVQNVTGHLPSKMIWFMMNFTEPQFYAGLFASMFIIAGGGLAWILDQKNSKYAGFPVSYSSNLFPWVLASQLLSLSLTIFVFNFVKFFDHGFTWLPTFITVVGIAPALMLIYGPGLAKLITVSLLASLISFPTAHWLNETIMPIINVPGVVANVTTMALTGLIICAIAKALPWMTKREAKPLVRTGRPDDNMDSPLWALRRALADFSEAQFYGSEIAGLFVVVGVVIDCLVNVNHPAYGSGVVPAILLSQFVGAGVGIYLYTEKFKQLGWYATYVPVVSVGPGCVLLLGGTIPIAVLAGVLGGIIGPPLAEYLYSRLPEDYHITIGNVASMAISTVLIAMVIKYLLV